jgi:predicted GIY-YIG superfamily endonuclease
MQQRAYLFSVVANRTDKGNGRPICSGRQVLKGFNDLQTKFPAVALEAYGWDPTTILSGSGQKKEWICNKEHIYSSTVNNRTSSGNGCPICSGQQVLKGFNDLQTKFPAVALEAYSWDPTTILSGSGQKKDWKCNKEHIYSSTVNNRTSSGNGCPICSGHQVLKGFNDLQTKFPAVALEAYGWNPEIVTNKSGQKKDWKCSKGHIYVTTIAKRTSNGNGCPICSGHQVLKGFNDLQTKFPDIAAEAYGWDPTTTLPASNQKKEWKCGTGHIYSSVVASRTSNGNGCPICSGQQVLKGFNDLQTKFPDIAAEAYGWDPTIIMPGTDQKKEWKCNKGHIYYSSVSGRTGRGSGCSICADYGFNPAKDAWFYLMQRPGEQQLGITNDFSTRMKKHESNGWTLLEYTKPAQGKKVQEIETVLKRWLKKEIGLMEGTTENWSTTSMEVQSLAELKERSGIETDLF